MQHKALVAFATVLIMMMAAFPLGVAVSSPAENDFSAGWYWESNSLDKDKVSEAYGNIELPYSILDSLFVTDCDYWDLSVIEYNLKMKDAMSYSTFPYVDNNEYYETESRSVYIEYGHIKVSMTPDESSIGMKLFDLEEAEVSGELKSLIEDAVIAEDMVLTIECDLEFVVSMKEDKTFILNNNGKYIANSYTIDREYLLKSDNVKVTCDVSGEKHEFNVNLYDCTYGESITRYCSDKDPTEKGMKQVEKGDKINATFSYHNSWDNWYATITKGSQSATIKSTAVSSLVDEYSKTVTDASFVGKNELKSLSTLYKSWYYGKGGDVEKTESFLKSNGHFEKGYECGKYYYNVIYNDYMDVDEGYSKYIKSKTKSSSDNTLLYAVSAIAVVLLIALIALAVMYKKKTA